jgi:hypothetical protein
LHGAKIYGAPRNGVPCRVLSHKRHISYGLVFPADRARNIVQIKRVLIDLF